MIRWFLFLVLLLTQQIGIAQNGFGFQAQLTLQLGAPINAIGMQTNFFYAHNNFTPLALDPKAYSSKIVFTFQAI
jgi:hypothetical protein